MAQLKDLYSLEGVEQSGGTIYRHQDGKNVELAVYENGLWQITDAGRAALDGDEDAAPEPVKPAKPAKAAKAPAKAEPAHADAGDIDLG